MLYLTTTLGYDHTRISRGKKLVIPYMYNIHKINNVVFVLCLLFTTFFITETVDLQILCNIWTTVHKIDLCICWGFQMTSGAVSSPHRYEYSWRWGCDVWTGYVQCDLTLTFVRIYVRWSTNQVGLSRGQHGICNTSNIKITQCG